MFAGAAREAVFSNPEVVRRVNADFVPVALKAGMVNNPPRGLEGELYAEIGRSKPAPQGICVINCDGKVLDWALMFDNDKSVIEFLDHTLKRFAEFPDASKSVPAERYMKYPSQKLADVRDTGRAVRIPEQHADNDHCPGTFNVPDGTLIGSVIGRALDEDGKPVADTLRQEHYLESRLEVALDAQQQFARALNESDGQRFEVPDAFARSLVGEAYLGQLDVHPLAGQRVGGQTDRAEWQFFAKRVDRDNASTTLVYITGESNVAGGQSEIGRRTDGRHWEHEVQLAWEGYAELRDEQVTRLSMVAHGREKLRWGNRLWKLQGDSGVSHLPAGHPIDLDCGVRYGLTAEPHKLDESNPVAVKQTPSAKDDTKKSESRADDSSDQLVAMLGPRFIVLRSSVWRELELASEQLATLEQLRDDEAAELAKSMRLLENQAPQERQRTIHRLRGEASERLEVALKKLLNAKQHTRLEQIELQHEGLFALGRPDVQSKLAITDAQRQRLATIMRELQRSVQEVQQRANASRDPRRLHQEMIEVRQERQQEIAQLLTADQKKIWSDMLGKPVAEK